MKIIFVLFGLLIGHPTKSQDIDFASDVMARDSMYTYYCGYVFNSLSDSCIFLAFSPNTSFDFDSVNSFAGRDESGVFILYPSIGDNAIDHMTRFAQIQSEQNIFFKFKIHNEVHIPSAIVFYYIVYPNNLLSRLLNDKDFKRSVEFRRLLMRTKKFVIEND